MSNRKSSKSADGKLADDTIENALEETNVNQSVSNNSVLNGLDETSKREVEHELNNDVAHFAKTTKRQRKPQSEANVTIFVSEYTPNMYHVYAKQGHSIVAVYGYIPSIDSFLNLAPTNEIAKSWGSMYDMVKANAQQVGNFHPSIAHNIQFVNSLVATIVKTDTATIVVDKSEAFV